MSSLFLLLKVRFDELLGISTTKHEKNLKKKSLKKLKNLVMALIGVLAVVVIYEIAVAMAERGLVEMLPVTSYVLGSVITLIVTILKINETITGNQDAQFLMSMPFSTVIQVVVMFLMLYLWNTLYTAMMAVPMGIVYISYTGATGAFIGRWILGILLTSLPASGIASLLGMVIAVFLSTSKNSNMIKSIISLSFLTVIMIFIVHMIRTVIHVIHSNISVDSANVGQEVITKITTNYKLSRFYQNGIVEGNGLWIFLFVLMSVIWYLFFVFFLSVSYQELILALQCPFSYQEYEWKELVQQDVKKTLFERELQQWMRSKSYMVSSLLGVIIAILLSAVAVIYGGQTLLNATGLVDYADQIRWSIPFVICFFVGMSCTTYCSMSIEGKRHWIMETMPMEDAVVYGCKCRLNLMITTPMVIISGLFMSIAFSSSIVGIIFNIMIPLMYAMLSASWGMRVDRKYADYSSESEIQAMHQSLSFFLGYLPQMVLPVVAIVGVWTLGL